ncbi:MAG: 4-alpha-glucanotransferase [Pyrinomonadaceae bacterium]
MDFSRSSGVLLHLTSLPNEFGIGDFGTGAYKFVDFLALAGQKYWQILPLGPTGYGDSPYQCFSAFAGNMNLISPEFLLEDALLTEEDLLSKPDFPVHCVNYGTVIEWKKEILQKAYARFRVSINLNLLAAFESFESEAAHWLEDYSLFIAIKEAKGNKNWLNWDEPLRMREPRAIDVMREELTERIRAEKFFQFLFFKQWKRLKNYANGKGIKIIGDIPIFVAADSADVWRNPEFFKLEDDLSPTVVSGVPPDYFSKTGQLWGNPIYNWNRMQESGFGWWIRRIGFTFALVDVIRIDHFRGFLSTWEVPGADETAENGTWVNVPGYELFATMQASFGELPIIAEDLGDITPEVRALRDYFAFPGMRILQYGFSGDASAGDLPHNYVRNCVAYTGTHDNETINGWLETKLEEISKAKQFRTTISPDLEDNTEVFAKQVEFCNQYINHQGKDFNWDMIRAIWSSVASITIAPMQDILGLGNEARMNTPATTSGNWAWRCSAEDFSEEIANRLREISKVYGRLNAG